jgi:uncharacterized protein DUF2752
VSAIGNAFSRLSRHCGEVPILFGVFSLLVIDRYGLLGRHFLVCPILWTTGRPCPTCGTTRSVLQILACNFREAWRLNPLGFIVVAAFAKRCNELFGPRVLRWISKSQTIEVAMLSSFLGLGALRFIGWL